MITSHYSTIERPTTNTLEMNFSMPKCIGNFQNIYESYNRIGRKMNIFIEDVRKATLFHNGLYD